MLSIIDDLFKYRVIKYPCVIRYITYNTNVLLVNHLYLFIKLKFNLNLN